MTSPLRPYSAYKESGSDLIGRIPRHWEISRLRHVANLLVSNVDKHSREGEIPVRLCNYVDVYKNRRITDGLRFAPATATPAEIERFRLKLEDVIITKDSEAWDDIGVPSLVAYEAPDLICGYHLAILRPHDRILLGRYLFYAQQSVCTSAQYHVSANGVTRYGLTHQAIRDSILPVPPPAEQAAIAQYLASIEHKIGGLIRAKQRVLGLLTEQRRLIAQRVVTRGVDPRPPRKSSGLGWLGEVPVHWPVKRIGRLFIQRQEPGRADLPILEVSLRTGVRVRDFTAGARKQQIAERERYKRARQGDLAYNMMRMWQGAVGVAPVDGLVSPAYVVARPVEGVDVAYFDLLFHTAPFLREVDGRSRGIVKDRNRLYWEDFKQIAVPCPPLDEQRQIVAHIERAAGSIDRAMSRIERELSLIHEYRTRLIADVVTGKLDVREAAARLPEPAYDTPDHDTNPVPDELEADDDPDSDPDELVPATVEDD